jgi:hypothetical protein
MTQHVDAASFDSYLNLTGQAIANLRNAKKYVDSLSTHGGETPQHIERLNYIVQLIQEHVKLHLEEFGVTEARLNLKHQTKQTTEKLMRLIKSQEKEIATDQKVWEERIEKQPTKRARTSSGEESELMDIDTWTTMNCTNERFCSCCDRYADYLIDYWKLNMAFDKIKYMTQGPKKRQEIWRRLEFLVPLHDAYRFKTLAKGCLTKCIER